MKTTIVSTVSLALALVAGGSIPAQARMSLGVETGFATGIDGFKTGDGAIVTLGYELPGESRDRHTFELSTGGHVSDAEAAHRDELRTGFVMLGYRYTRFFSEPDNGLFAFAGGAIGSVGGEFDRRGQPGLEDYGNLGGRAFAGGGYAFSPKWRVQLSYHRFISKDFEDRGVRFLDGSGHNFISAGFNLRF